MKIRAISLSIMLGLIGGHAAAQAINETAPRKNPTTNPRDFTGIWTPDQAPFYTDRARGEQAPPPPLTPQYAEQFRKVTDAAREGVVLNDPGANCIPGGMPRIMINPYPMEILQQPDRVTFLFEYQNQIRRVFMDGRKHPPEIDPTYLGHSIGRWEGDVLVIETVGLRADTMFDASGIPHSGKLTVVERISKESPTTLAVEITAIDPEALARPWTIKRTYTLQPDYQIMENVCLENNRNPVDEQGRTRTVLANGALDTPEP